MDLDGTQAASFFIFTVFTLLPTSESTRSPARPPKRGGSDPTEPTRTDSLGRGFWRLFAPVQGLGWRLCGSEGDVLNAACAVALLGAACSGIGLR